MSLIYPVGVCPACDKIRPLRDVEAIDGTKFCQPCISRNGAENLKNVVGASVAARVGIPPTSDCLRCRTPLVPGTRGLYCSNCNQVYKDRFGKAVKWR